jgi:hypothetical protein
MAALAMSEGTVQVAPSAVLTGLTVRFGLLIARGQPTTQLIPAHIAALVTEAAATMVLT